MVQVDGSHYDFNKYENVERFASYWKQVEVILALAPNDVLEVGVGSGITRHMLTKAGLAVTTADFDETLQPDVVADVRKLPFNDASFDVVAAFQILEHLPFDQFPVALAELARVSRRHVCISLPDAGRYARLGMRLPGDLRLDWMFDVARLMPKKHVFDGEHYWEINKVGYWPDTVRAAIGSAGLVIEQELRLPQNPYHRFYTLRKGQSDSK